MGPNSAAITTASARALAAAAAATYLEDEMFFASLLIFLASSHRPPALAAFVLEQVERRHFAVGPHQLQRALLVVLGRLRNAIQVQCDRTWKRTEQTNRSTRTIEHRRKTGSMSIALP